MFNIVLFEPEIPPNTGNIIRLCVNTNSNLHLIKPMGFNLDEKPLKRAGLDYHDLAKVEIYEDYDACYHNLCQFRHFAVTTKASKHYHEFEYEAGDVFIFGPEKENLPPRKVVNEYDEVLIKNKKSNEIKKSIISTLELIAYKEWAVDSLVLIEKKYESMDSVLIQRLEDIKFEFGYSGMLKKINNNKNTQLDLGKDQNKDINIQLQKLLILDEIDSLNNTLSYHRRSLDTLRSLSRYKFYLNQPRFTN